VKTVVELELILGQRSHWLLYATVDRYQQQFFIENKRIAIIIVIIARIAIALPANAILHLVLVNAPSMIRATPFIFLFIAGPKE
jgi:hypothetical protein